jgi:hypothetical protein
LQNNVELSYGFDACVILAIAVMRFYSHSDQPPARPSRFRLFLFLVLIYGCVKVFGGQHLHLQPFHIPHGIAPLPPPIVQEPGIADAASPGSRMFHLIGRRVWGDGTSIDLGDRRTHLPGSLLSRFFPDELILPSCLTEVPPSALSVTQRLLPVRDDWPGFYGAPWVARLDGNLIVLLNVYAPRKSGLPVPAPQFEFYPGYAGGSLAPALSITAPAKLYRGSKAVLYRVFLNGQSEDSPVRCLDLVVQHGENNGVGRLYYQKYHHYYESDASFVIQK